MANGLTAPGQLPGKNIGIQRGLFNDDVLPIDVELLGHDHRHRSLDVLADFGIGRHDGHHTVIADFKESVDLEPFFGHFDASGDGLRLLWLTRLEETKAENQSATGQTRISDESTAAHICCNSCHDFKIFCSGCRSIYAAYVDVRPVFDPLPVFMCSHRILLKHSLGYPPPV